MPSRPALPELGFRYLGVTVAEGSRPPAAGVGPRADRDSGRAPHVDHGHGGVTGRRLGRALRGDRGRGHRAVHGRDPQSPRHGTSYRSERRPPRSCQREDDGRPRAGSRQSLAGHLACGGPASPNGWTRFPRSLPGCASIHAAMLCCASSRSMRDRRPTSPFARRRPRRWRKGSGGSPSSRRPGRASPSSCAASFRRPTSCVCGRRAPVAGASWLAAAYCWRPFWMATRLPGALRAWRQARRAAAR